MRIEPNQLKLFLLDSNLVPKETVEQVAAEAQKDGKNFGTLLLEKKLIEEADSFVNLYSSKKFLM